MYILTLSQLGGGGEIQTPCPLSGIFLKKRLNFYTSSTL